MAQRQRSCFSRSGPGFESQYYGKSILMLQRFIDGTGQRTVDRGLIILIKPILSLLDGTMKKLLTTKSYYISDLLFSFCPPAPVLVTIPNIFFRPSSCDVVIRSQLLEGRRFRMNERHLSSVASCYPLKSIPMIKFVLFGSFMVNQLEQS